MKSSLSLVIALLSLPLLAIHAAELRLSVPPEYQVTQRTSRVTGTIRIAGTIKSRPENDMVVEVRILADGKAKDGSWEKLTAAFNAESFEKSVEVPAGGWHRLEAQVVVGNDVIARSAVEHVGIGQVFVVAGQSNSAYHGEVKQVTQTKRVSAFNGIRWQIANDPQPGASGKGGGFMPSFVQET